MKISELWAPLTRLGEKVQLPSYSMTSKTVWNTRSKGGVRDVEMDPHKNLALKKHRKSRPAYGTNIGEAMLSPCEEDVEFVLQRLEETSSEGSAEDALFASFLAYSVSLQCLG